MTPMKGGLGKRTYRAEKTHFEVLLSAPKKFGVSFGELCYKRIVHREVKQSLNIMNQRLCDLELKMDTVLSKVMEMMDKLLGSPNVLFNSSVKPEVEQLTESSQIIKLPSLDSHPDGCWLGDPNIEGERVRVRVTPGHLAVVDSSCNSPEKTALALMETLFSREVLASSNLTGKGRHKKKQLDPLLVFGIYCHLKFRFNIQESDWSRIKNNMDAKCRFFWSRRSKGLPLGDSRVLEDFPSDRPQVMGQLCDSEPVYHLDSRNFTVSVGDGGEIVTMGGDSLGGEEHLICGTVMVTTQGGNVLLSEVVQTQPPDGGREEG